MFRFECMVSIVLALVGILSFCVTPEQLCALGTDTGASVGTVVRSKWEKFQLGKLSFKGWTKHMV